MRVVAIIQQRMGSTRLPGKAKLELAGKSMTQNIIERVQRSRVNTVVLAFPDTRTDADTYFADLAVRSGCSYYRGTGLEEADLVGRHLGAAALYHADIIVRVPGDNPCVDPVCIDMAVEEYFRVPYVFYSNTTAQIGSMPVDGVGCEVFSLSRLKWLDVMTAHSPVHREHPHRYFEECQHEYGNGIRFWHGGTAFRLDVNDARDYKSVKMIYDHFGHNRFTLEEALAYIRRTVSVG